MKISTKAAIYSAIVFPGAGYFIVQKKRRAMLALAITLICLALLMYEAVHKAHIIAQKIVSGMLPYDISAIREHIKTTTGVLPASIVVAATAAIVIVWIIALIDSYQLGRAADDASNNKQH